MIALRCVAMAINENAARIAMMMMMRILLSLLLMTMVLRYLGDEDCH